MIIKNKRSWQRMLSGRRLNLLEPSPLDIEIKDIAHGLSRLARWNGQTAGKFPISVAQHSVLVAEIFEEFNTNILKKWILAALLHDASEYIIGDMITPLKNILGDKFSKLEKNIQSSIHLRFSIPRDIPLKIYKKIKVADRKVAFLEATQLAGFSNDEASKIIFKPKNIPKIKITPLNVKKSNDLFLNKFNELN